MSKLYLGDGVYIDTAERGYGEVITTENGIDVTNKIYLEPTVAIALLRYLEKEYNI